MLIPWLEPRTAPHGGPRGPLPTAVGRVPWLVALLVSVSVTLVVAFPLFLWSRDAVASPPVAPGLAERHGP